MGVPQLGLRNVAALKKRPLLPASPPPRPAKRPEVAPKADEFDFIHSAARHRTELLQQRSSALNEEEPQSPWKPERRASTGGPPAGDAPPAAAPASPRPVGGASGSPFRLTPMVPKGAGAFLGHEFRRQRAGIAADTSRVVAPSSPGQKTGYRNLGNTCYINAMLSALSNLPCFVNDLVDSQASAVLAGADGGALLALTQIVRQSIAGTGGSVNPASLKQAVAKYRDTFSSFHQQDAHEFFLALLDQVHEEVMAALPPALAASSLNPHNTPSPVQRNFEGAITHRLECKGCGAKTHCVEVFYALSLPLPQLETKSELRTQDLLDYFMSKSTQESHCEQCGHREAVAHHHFSVLPRVLVLHLQRSGAQFAAAQAFVGHAKRSDPCAVSFEVDAEPHCTPDVLFPPPVARRTSDLLPTVACGGASFSSYALRAMALHVGEAATSGHYKCLVAQADGPWREFDDEYVRPKPRAEVAAVGRHSAYLLFYEFSNLLPA